MARRKQLNPMQRIPSGEVMQQPSDLPDFQNPTMNGHSHKPAPKRPSTTIAFPASTPPSSSQAGLAQLVVCIAGIYASFLSWALLQERITTTPYTPRPSSLLPAPAAEYFRFSVVLNTIQSLFAFAIGSITRFSSSTPSRTRQRIFPTNAIIVPLIVISITSSLASPFGYASLAHVDYLTFVLAKSCKLLPVMFLHISLFRKRYPLSKYLIVLAVTSGVALFTLYHPPSKTKSKMMKSGSGRPLYGLSLLGVNLLFDGLTNTVQDHIFTSPARYGRFSGLSMMIAQNLIATLLTGAYLLIIPFVPPILLPAIAQDGTNELLLAIGFLRRHPRVFYDVIGFAACGALGQLFIFATLQRFSSLFLVTVTVTRKMLTMLLSILWFGKKLTRGQLAGVGLVFAGVSAEGWIHRREKQKKVVLKKRS